jgi:hypothetical protein
MSALQIIFDQATKFGMRAHSLESSPFLFDLPQAAALRRVEHFFDEVALSISRKSAPTTTYNSDAICGRCCKEECVCEIVF